MDANGMAKTLKEVLNKAGVPPKVVAGVVSTAIYLLASVLFVYGVVLHNDKQEIAPVVQQISLPEVTFHKLGIYTSSRILNNKKCRKAVANRNLDPDAIFEDSQMNWLKPYCKLRIKEATYVVALTQQDYDAYLDFLRAIKGETK